MTMVNSGLKGLNTWVNKYLHGYNLDLNTFANLAHVHSPFHLNTYVLGLKPLKLVHSFGVGRL